ncbi:MAG: hypothetical protein LW808_001875 [Verrucomicrobiota bacterium]|nr:MAG: hypothetical protein LW808_001875 [Verrucomicrobiota bacterium]
MDMPINDGYNYPAPRQHQVYQAPAAKSSWGSYLPWRWFSGNSDAYSVQESSIAGKQNAPDVQQYTPASKSPATKSSWSSYLPWRWFSENSDTYDVQEQSIADVPDISVDQQYDQVSQTSMQMTYDARGLPTDPFANGADAPLSLMQISSFDDRLNAYAEELLLKDSNDKTPVLQAIFRLYKQYPGKAYAIHNVLNDWVGDIIPLLRHAFTGCRRSRILTQDLKNLLHSIDTLLYVVQSGGDVFKTLQEAQACQDLDTIVTRSRLLSYFEIFMQTDGVDLERFFNSIFDLWEDLHSPQMKRLISRILDMGNGAHRSINPVRNSRDLSAIYRYRRPN